MGGSKTTRAPSKGTKLELENAPQKVIHAAYYEDLVSIHKDGLQPLNNQSRAVPAPKRPSCLFCLKPQADDPGYNPQVIHTLERAPEQKFDRAGVEEATKNWRAAPTRVAKKKKQPDFYIEIDTTKLAKDTELYKNEDGTVEIAGQVPVEAFSKVEAVMPGDLPDDLKADVVNPFDFNQIPKIDMSESDDELLPKMKIAAQDIGFLTIINHGVDPKLIDRVSEKQKAFFELSNEVKCKYAITPESGMAGFCGVGAENMDNVDGSGGDQREKKHTRTDLKEFFDINATFGEAFEQAKKDDNSGVWTGNGIFPDDVVPGFKDTMTEYEKEVGKVAQRLMSLISRAVGLDEKIIMDSVKLPVSHHRLLHYPPLEDNYQDQVSIGAHIDYGFLTLLYQDSIGGLQALNAKAKTWVHVPPVKYGFIINFGAMLAQWTGHKIKATIHRVVNLSTEQRYSHPVFFRPALSTVLNPQVFDKDAKEGNSTCLQILAQYYQATGQYDAGSRPASPVGSPSAKKD